MKVSETMPKRKKQMPINPISAELMLESNMYCSGLKYHCKSLPTSAASSRALVNFTHSLGL